MTHSKSNRNYNSGFSLVEVLISGAILIVAISAIAVLISSGSKLNREDMLLRRAYQVIEEILERPEYGFQNYKNLLDNNSTPDEQWQNLGNVDLYDMGGQTVIAAVSRCLERELYDFGGTQIPGIKLTIRLQYEGKTESISTIITNVPID